MILTLTCLSVLQIAALAHDSKRRPSQAEAGPNCLSHLPQVRNVERLSEIHTSRKLVQHPCKSLACRQSLKGIRGF